jgi:hypothetical protein
MRRRKVNTGLRDIKQVSYTGYRRNILQAKYRKKSKMEKL